MCSQIKELQATVTACEKHCDVVVFGTPINLGKIIHMQKPVVRVRYELKPENDTLNKLLGCVVGECEEH